MSIEEQIKTKNLENKTLTARLAATPSDYIGASRTITNTIKENGDALQILHNELVKAQDTSKAEKNKFELSAWVIFSQLTNFKWSDPSHIFALLLILGIGFFFEMLIYATTPRRIKK